MSTLIKTFPGGVYPEANKKQSTHTPIACLPLFKHYVLPLNQHSGTPAKPLVSVGDKVLKGQLLARADRFVSAPVHAPTSGTITAIGPHSVPSPSGLKDTCIILNSDGEDRWCQLTPTPNYQLISTDILVERIYAAGIVGLGGAGFPTAVKMASRSEKKIHTLIVNGAECEPYITADDMLMRERADNIIHGIDILCHMLHLECVLIGIEGNKPEAIQSMEKACKERPWQVVSIPTKYPSGDAQRLIYTLTGKEVPNDARSVEMGFLCYNVGTLAAVADAIIEGKPLISRITTLTGAALKYPQNVEAPIGALANELLRFAGINEEALYHLVLGGPMMGFSLDNTAIPVIKTTNCYIAATKKEFPPATQAQPCIRCGICAEVCPCSLLPQQLLWHAQDKNHERLLHHNLFDCIECGACSFVCPSSIPLVQYYRASKSAIRDQELKHEKSERSRQRFEFRQERLQREQAEKAARRKANAKRTAQLKAAQTVNPEVNGTIDNDPVKAAIARAKAKQTATREPTSVQSVLSPHHRELNIQLATAKAQLKKAERMITQADSPDQAFINKQQANITMLKNQIAQLQCDMNTLPTVDSASKKKLAPETKKLKVAQALAKAALVKAEKAWVAAQENGGDDLNVLQKNLEHCQTTLNALTEQLTAEAVHKPKRILTIDISDTSLQAHQRDTEGKTITAKQAIAQHQNEDVNS